MLLVAIVAVLFELKTARQGFTFGKPLVFNFEVWAPIGILSGLVILCTVLVAVAWFYHAFRIDSFRASLLYSFRSLDITSGVSPLAPLLLISVSSFVWAVVSFHRIKMLEGFESTEGFLAFSPTMFPDLKRLEDKIRYYLQCAARGLPAAGVVFALTLAAAVFCLVRFVHSIERESVYLLLWISYFSAVLALTLGVLRFLWVWKQTRTLLQHLTWTPMRTASKRFRASVRTLPKIDLAAPAPSLAPLSLALDQLGTIVRHAHQLLTQNSPAGTFQVKLAVAGAEVEAAGNTQAATADLSAVERTALVRFESPEFKAGIVRAETHLRAASDADTDENWRRLLINQYYCQEQLSELASDVSGALEPDWWQEIRPLAKKEDRGSDADSTFQLAEVFVAGRVWHFLAHVFPQLEMLIYAPVAGILLLLFAISSYPFQPHNLLLWFNSAIIIGFVAAALWVFVQINRDPILSNFNGTTPGKITWDKEFILRVVLYGVIPILALLGAQFPDTVGQIISYIAPAESVHP